MDNNERNKVGASIVNAITESLYDNPIVVFREYVQNSADSLKNVAAEYDKKINIEFSNNTLFFLDNGKGITPDNFSNVMTSIGASYKTRTDDIGYKGIGRLSGISYSKNLYFINILNFKDKKLQIYRIDCEQYRKLKNSSQISSISFAQLMDNIGRTLTEDEISSFIGKSYISTLLVKYSKMYNENETGFIVMLENVNSLLSDVINSSDFLDELGWLLPVAFDKADFSSDNAKNGYKAIKYIEDNLGVALNVYNIFYNDKKVLRPLKDRNFREFSTVKNLDYGLAILNFNNDKMTIEKANSFSGIKIYLDNILLCDENELIPALSKYGVLKSSSVNEAIQSVRSIGAIIYISAKSMIYANARRTFIEVYDTDSMDFLVKISSCIENINSTRYALSRVQSEFKKIECNQDKLKTLVDKANQQLSSLADFQCLVADNISNRSINFEDLPLSEKRKAIKNKINHELTVYIKNYLEQTSDFNYDTAGEDFLNWIKNQQSTK